MIQSRTLGVINRTFSVSAYSSIHLKMNSKMLLFFLLLVPLTVLTTSDIEATHRGNVGGSLPEHGLHSIEKQAGKLVPLKNAFSNLISAYLVSGLSLFLFPILLLKWDILVRITPSKMLSQG